MSAVTVTVDEYSVTFDNGRLTATRHGKPWRDLLGDNLVLSLMRRILGLQRCEDFARSILNPEELGRAVPAHVRDDAREALGRDRVETKGGDK